MKPWKRIEPTIVTKVGYRTVLVKHFEQPSGKIVDRTIMNEDGWAGACAIVVTKDKKVVLARQYRPGPEKIFDELPGGIVDSGESPEECVIREVGEETGYRPGEVEYLGACYYDAYVNGDRHYFLLTECERDSKDWHGDHDECIEIVTVDIDTLLDNAKRGLMSDIGGVLMAYDKLMKLKEGK